MIRLRPYQDAAVRALYRYFEKQAGNPLVVLPTGTGKSVVLAEFIRTAIAQYPDTRIVLATHQKELIAQDYQKLLALWPDAPAGVFSAGLGRRQLDRSVTFAGIQSVYRHGLKLPAVDLLLVDEVHTIPRRGNGMWRQFIADLTINNPYLKTVGFTATPYRMDSGMLHEGEGALFDDIAYEAGLVDMVRAGYLTELVTLDTRTKLDVSGVHMRGGEFVESELQAAVDVDEVTRAAVAEVLRYGGGRGSWLLFCSGVRHAKNVCAALQAAGIPSASVDGETPAVERDGVLRRFRSGELRAVTNNNVLTVGVDIPSIDLIACLRPTGSPGLWVQMLGRGMRLAPGKKDCLVLDFANNVERHGHIDRIRPTRKKKGVGQEGAAPSKGCPQCGMILHASVRICHECGHCFPKADPQIADKASAGTLLSCQEEPKWVPVSRVLYHRHRKDGKPDSMKVDYLCGPRRYSEWVCVEYSGPARERAARWWAARSPGARVPNTVTEALAAAPNLPVPSAIRVWEGGKFPEVTGYDFGAAVNRAG